MLILATIILIYVAHLFRVYRWQILLGSISDIGRKKLHLSLAISYCINFILPIRIGDLFRIFYIGAKIRNILFVLSTVLLERLTDIIFLQILFSVFILLHYSNLNPLPNLPITSLTESSFDYLVLITTLGFCLILMVTNSKLVKILILKISNLLNESLKILLLRLFFRFFHSNKQLFKNFKKGRFLVITLFMWNFYILGYFTAQQALAIFGYRINGLEILLKFTNPINFGQNHLTTIYLFSLVLYLAPAILLLITYLLSPKSDKTRKGIANYQLNFRNTGDELIFLEDYFYSKDRNWSKSYYEIFEGYEIIKDFTGLSGASTVLVKNKNGEKSFMKFSLGSDNDELRNQFNFMSSLKILKNFAQLESQENNNYFLYKMPYAKGYIPLNKGLNSISVSKIDTLFNDIFRVLDYSLYSTTLELSNKPDLIEKYYSDKVLTNLILLQSFLEKSGLSLSSKLLINGEETGFSFSDVFNTFSSQRDNFIQLFYTDSFTLSHGDLTSENIIINTKSLDFYFIDLLPLTGNLSSKASDIGKLKLSSAYHLELIREYKDYHVDSNTLNFPVLTIPKMNYLDSKLDSIIDAPDFYGNKSLVNLYTTVHWIRVLSRRIKYNDPKAMVYAGNFFLSLKKLEPFSNLS